MRIRVQALLCIFLLVFMYAFAGGAKDSTDKVKLTFATSVYVEEPHQKAIDGLIAAFNKAHPNIEVEVYGAGYANFWDNATTEIMGGNEADILQVYPENVASYDSLRTGGVFVDLSQYMQGKDYKTMLAGQDMCEFKGKVLALSNYAWGTTAIFYRKSLLKASGIDPQSIKTWQDFVEASRKLKAKGIIGMGVVNSSHGFVVSEWARMLAREVSNGLYFPNAEKGPFNAGNVQVNNAANVWAAKEWQNYLLKEALGKAAPDKKDSREYFWNGLAAFNYDGPWFIGMCESRDPKLLNDIGLIPSPAVVYNGKTYPANPTNYPLVTCLSKNCKNPEAAWTFMQWMTSAEAQKIIASCGMIPASTAYSTSAEYKAKYPMSATFAEYFKNYGPQIADPFIPQQGELNQIMIEETQKIFAAGQDPQKVLDNAAARIKAVMNKK